MDLKVSVEYPDGKTRMVEAYQRLVPIVKEDSPPGQYKEQIFVEPVENDDWTFIFQVDQVAPEGGFFRAIPLRDNMNW